MPQKKGGHRGRIRTIFAGKSDMTFRWVLTCTISTSRSVGHFLIPWLAKHCSFANLEFEMLKLELQKSKFFCAASRNQIDNLM